MWSNSTYVWYFRDNIIRYYTNFNHRIVFPNTVQYGFVHYSYLCLPTLNMISVGPSLAHIGDVQYASMLHNRNVKKTITNVSAILYYYNISNYINRRS